MANQSAPIQEVSRLLDLVPFLSTHSNISLKELAAEFGVTEKAMANELTALSMCGLPGYTPYELIEIFFDSGFVTINNHDALDIPRALTQLEVASLLIGLEILRDSASAEKSPLIAEIERLISELKALLKGTITISENPITVYQSIIESSIAHRRSLSLEYRSPARDEIATRKVDPFSLRSFTDAGDKSEFRLKVTGDRRALAEALLIPDIKGDSEVAIEVYSPEWLKKAIVAHAPYVELLGDKEARVEIRSLAENILALYSS